MQLAISLHPDFPVRVPFSYYHFLSGAVYGALNFLDSDLASRLHDGSNYSNRIKLFSISPLVSNMVEVHGGKKGSHLKELANDCYLLFKGPTFFNISTASPDLARAFIAAFSNLEFFRLGSQVFRIGVVNILPDPVFKEDMTWISPGSSSIVTNWTIRNQGKKVYQMPINGKKNVPSCNDLLKNNIVHKWKRLVECDVKTCHDWLDDEKIQERDLKEALSVDLIALDVLSDLEEAPYKTRLHHLKNTPVLSWRAPVRIKAPKIVQRLVCSCGLGQLNSMGFGLVKEMSL